MKCSRVGLRTIYDKTGQIDFCTFGTDDAVSRFIVAR